MGRKKLLMVIASALTIITIIALSKTDNSNSSTVQKITLRICESSINYEDLDKSFIMNAKKEMNNTKEKDSKYFLKGYFCYSESNYEEAEKYFKLAFKYFDEDDDTILKINNGKFLANCLVKQNKDDEAIKVVKDTFDLVPKEEYENVYEHIWGLLYSTGYAKGGYTLIINSLNSILNSNHELSKKCQLYIYERLASANNLKKNYSTAVYLTAKTIAIAHELNDSFKEAVLKIDLASMIFELDGYKRGEQIIHEALDIKLDNKYENSEAKLYGYASLVEAYFKLEQYDDALKYCDKIEQHKKNLDPDIYNDMAIYRDVFSSMIYTSRGELEKSKEFLDEAYKLLQEDDYWYFVGKDIYYYQAAGKYYQAKENYEQATENFEKALKATEDNDMDLRKTEILESLFILYDKQGNVKERDKYQKLVVQEYKKNKIIRNKENISYIMDKVDSEKEILENAQKEINIYKIGSISICTVIILFVILGGQLKKSRRQSYIDGLTGIYNRRYFDITYKKYIDKNENFSVIMMDIDNFKNINDTYGHKFGDIVIKGITDTISDLIDEDDKEFRYGGEEFVALLKNKNAEEAAKIAEKIRSAVEVKIWKKDISVTLSLGVAEYKKDYSVIETADKNLYIAKKSGKNKVVD